MSDSRSIAELEAEGSVGADYLEALLDILDFDGDLEFGVSGERAFVELVGGEDLECFVGEEGKTLEALQTIVRLAVAHRIGERSDIMLDVLGWREGVKRDVEREVAWAADELRTTGLNQNLRPMTPFERKVAHDFVGTLDGVSSHSEGLGPSRHLILTSDEEITR